MLAPNEWLTVPLTVTIPLTAPIDDMDFVTITATGLQGSVSAAVRTNSLYGLFLPIVIEK